MLDSPSWTWGLALIVLTTAIHSFGIFILSLLGVRIRAYLKRQSFHLWQAVTVLTMLIGTIGLSLAVLHGIEAALWAEAYLLLGALDTPAEAMLFSIDSMTTRGASGLTLHQHWQEMGALEGVAGVLMFGISTAYMFFVMQLYFLVSAPVISRRRMHVELENAWDHDHGLWPVPVLEHREFHRFGPVHE